MKMIVAYVKHHRLSEVILALQEIKNISGASIGEVQGFGRGRARNAPDRMQRDLTSYVPRIRVEVASDDAFVPQVVGAIENAAHTGLRGDGKIYVLNIEEAVRISTHERDPGSI